MAQVELALPPRPVIRTLNTLLRPLLRTPMGRPIPFALLEFKGRRSGRPLSAVVGWHSVGSEQVVVTLKEWPKNFTGGADAVVHVRGRSHRMRGVYIDDPEEVAAAFRAIIAAGASPASLALKVPKGLTVQAADVARTGRTLIRFTPTT